MALTVPDRDDWFEMETGYPRPNWGAVQGWMRVFVPSGEQNEAWEQWTRHWINRLRATLGGGYAWDESANFILLSEQAPSARSKVLAFLEQADQAIHQVLGDLAIGEAHGKHILLRFTEQDDYYTYVSHFHPDGEYATSSGMFLHDGYLHIAYLESWSPDEERRVVAHELTHNLLCHLPLPLWLNEALAMTFETDLGGSTGESITRELVEKHREYWNAETIQSFWRGEAFQDPEGQEVAYSLARVLLQLVHTEVRPPKEEVRKFVLRADWSDAGAVAAREHLGVDLGEVAGVFLGPGKWAPQPKAWKKIEPQTVVEQPPDFVD